ncbi:MAG TPA: DNA polymerase, partial [Patescibacteria group bacterium]|nr:DNA polymerase [Patescibacteria group bacterium]
FIDGQIDKARKEGYVETMWGRRRYIPEINSQVPTVRSGAERIAINTPLQGSSADMIKQAMIEVHKLLQDKYPDRVKMLIQVHDELLFEVPEELVSEVEQKVKKIMKEVVKLRVPVIVDAEAGYNWSEMEKI